MSVGGWGHKVLKTLIQGEDDELAIVEIIEDSVISPENATTIYPVFRMLIQVIYDAGTDFHHP